MCLNSYQIYSNRLIVHFSLRTRDSSLDRVKMGVVITFSCVLHAQLDIQPLQPSVSSYAYVLVASFDSLAN